MGPTTTTALTSEIRRSNEVLGVRIEWVVRKIWEERCEGPELSPLGRFYGECLGWLGRWVVEKIEENEAVYLM